MILRIQTSPIFKKNLSFFLILLLGILSIGCKDDSKKDNSKELQIKISHQELSEVEKLVDKAINQAGGMKS